MTDEQIRAVATLALDAIARTPPKQVFAARKGIVAAVNNPAPSIKCAVAFRRKEGVVHMETWPTSGRTSAPSAPIQLAADLQARAGKMLDDLP